MSYKRLLVALFVVTAFALLPQMANAQDDMPKQVELQFVVHPQAGMVEQDVYMETENGLVARIPAEEVEANLDTPLFTSATARRHDPFAIYEDTMDAVEMGTELGFTLGDWVSPTGEGTYTVMGDHAEVDISLQNLVPDGVYTVWCATANTPPNFRIVDIPCGNSYGTENVVVADGDGNAAPSPGQAGH